MKKKILKKASKWCLSILPLYEEYGPEWPFEEGCLSIPNIHAEVETHHSSKNQISGMNSFNAHEMVFDEMNARVIQHEYDHIEGILFVEKIKPSDDN
jgi:peptide deformylase